VPTVGSLSAIPRELPQLGLPQLSLIGSLGLPALSIAIIGLVQGAGVSQGTPNPGGRYPDVSRDFLATLIIPLQFAVLFGVALSILLNTIRQSNKVAVTQWVLQPQGFPLEQPAPRHLPSQQLTVLHIYGSLFFAAAKKVEEVLPAVGSLGVQQGFEGGGSIGEGVTGSEGWTIYHQSRSVHANGQDTNGDEVFAVPPGREFCLACKPSHEWISVHLPTSLLFPSTPELEFASCARAQLLKPPPHLTRRFTSLVHRVLAAIESQPQLLDCPVAEDSCRHELLSAAQDLFASCQHSSGRHLDRWRRLTMSTLEQAMSCPDQSPSVAELARQAGVPERTLRSAFHGSYDLSPHEYLRIQRLYQARRLLGASCQDQTTDTQIAFGLGFWDLGRFAGTYRSLYGERPSKTLRRPVPASIGVRYN
jgi:AraC-like DNA-binding protein